MKGMDKQYGCTKCGNSSSAAEWNKKTVEVLSAEEDEIIEIEDAENANSTYFICPACENPSFGYQISVVAAKGGTDHD